MLNRPEQGCLVIADVSGYTGYLAGTELDHAQDVLADLIGTVVGALRPVLRLAKLEGDAAFAYASSGRVDGTMLLDTIDGCYFAFRRRLRDIRHATTCQCNACRMIPSLDLKFLAHDGTFIRQRIAGREELAGPDVILVHRLLKNSVTETLGVRGYALFTSACVATMGIDPLSLGMRQHSETYEHTGNVTGYVQDLERRWREEQEHWRIVVEPEDAVLVMDFVFPAPPPVVWEYLTVPDKRVLWQPGVDRVDEWKPGGRRGAGTENHCVHGKDAITEEILDWRPFVYFTDRSFFQGFGGVTSTFEFEPAGDGTRLQWRVKRFRRRAQREKWPPMAEMLQQVYRAGAARLATLLTEEMARRARDAGGADRTPS
ncbi:MAG: DUF2652 domain-containing protein [Armatimonadota bacterium]|nr:DUF2652 domain-containing protein [Armatimonadota bacterium]MDR7550966.1 DUF2652 domain-containing protein [Armatimonadota bacterium]